MILVQYTLSFSNIIISSVSIFQTCNIQKQLWLEFVPVWTIRGEQNGLVEEWMEVAAYQKPLRSKAYPPESSPDTGKG